MAGQAMVKTMADWEAILAGIDANKENIPHIEGFYVALQAQLADLRAELTRRSVLQAEVLKSSRTIKESLIAGGDLAGRIGSFLKARYGRNSEKLIEFGIKPNRKNSFLIEEEEKAPWKPAT